MRKKEWTVVKVSEDADEKNKMAMYLKGGVTILFDEINEDGDTYQLYLKGKLVAFIQKKNNKLVEVDAREFWDEDKLTERLQKLDERLNKLHSRIEELRKLEDKFDKTKKEIEQLLKLSQ